MLALARRQLLVAGLILAAGAAALAVSVPDPAPPALPALATMTAGSGWHLTSAAPPVAQSMRYDQWLLDDGAGHQALLYVGATARARTILDWSGELGYLGDGYVVTGRHDASLQLPDGRAAAVSESAVRHVDDRRLLTSAVVGPAGVARGSGDLLLPAALDLVRGDRSTYYAVRVSVADEPGAGARGSALLASVLARLLTISR